jgi:hypothetical protein
MQIALSALELRQVQDVVDHPAQSLRGIPQHPHVAVVPIGGAVPREPLLELVGEQDDRVERRAELVGNRRKEAGLEMVELLEPAVRLRPLAADPPLLADRPPDANERTRPGAQLDRLDGLSDEVVGPGREPALPVDRSRRDEEDGNVLGGAGSDRRRQRVSRIGSEHHVDDGEIEGASSVEERGSLGGARRDRDAVAVRLQVAAEKLRDLGLIVDDENSSRPERRCPARRGRQRRLRSGPFEKPQDALRERLLVDRLGDESVAAGGERPFAVSLHGVRRDREDRYGGRGRVGADLAGGLPSRQDRQGEVHEDQVGPGGARGGDGRAAVGDRLDVVPVGLEEHLDERPDVRRVFGDQDPGHRRKSGPHPARADAAGGAGAVTVARTSRTSRVMSAPLWMILRAEPLSRA